MKWNKFKKVLEENPWLQSFVGSCNVISAPHNYPKAKAESMLKQWVRTMIEYISFRPFDSLDLDATSSWSHYGPEHRWTRYEVLFHIEGEKFAQRARSVDWHVDSFDHSVRAVIQGVRDWHQEFWAEQGKSLIFDAVIKNSGNEFSRSIEIFRFPEDFQLS